MVPSKGRGKLLPKYNSSVNNNNNNNKYYNFLRNRKPVPQPSLQKATNKSNFLRSCAILQFCAKCVKVLAREMLGRAKGSTRGFKESKHSSALVVSLGRKPLSLPMPGLQESLASSLCDETGACSVCRLADSREEKKIFH